MEIDSSYLLTVYGKLLMNYDVIIVYC